MELSFLNEEMSLWDGDLLMVDPFAQQGKYDYIQEKLPGLVWQDISDPGNNLIFATRVEEFKPGLDDFPSEMFQNLHPQLQYDDGLQDWMLEKMDFNLIDEMMNNHGHSDDLFNLEEFGFNDISNTVKSDLESIFPEHAFGLSELTPPVSPENKEIIETNDEVRSQHAWKYVFCKSVSESHVEQCKTTSEIMFPTPPESPEFNYSVENSPDTSYSSDHSINSIGFTVSSLPKPQLKRTVHNRKSADSPNLKANVSILKKVYHTKKDRKRSQNRNAATKYRIKKRSELDTLQQQCDYEETRNKELKTKISEISREVNYLKELMKEIMGSKGPKI